MSRVLLQLQSRLGMRVTLTEERYRAISQKHPEVEGQLSKVKLTLTEPGIIRRSMYNEKVLLFYKHFEKTPVSRKYLTVAIVLTNGEGFVLTSYFTDRIKMGEELWRAV